MTQDTILVMGIGNLLWADEGFGVRAVEELQRRYVLPDHVTVVDGGTQGIYLLPFVQQAKRMLVLDAVDFHHAPGTLITARDDEIPSYYGFNKLSLHQANFQELLSLAKLSGQFPDATALIGVQPQDISDYGGSLTPVVRGALDAAVSMAKWVLRGWGVAVEQRLAPWVPAGRDCLALGAYESGRPAAAEAWRHGDARVLNSALAAETA